MSYTILAVPFTTLARIGLPDASLMVSPFTLKSTCPPFTDSPLSVTTAVKTIWSPPLAILSVMSLSSALRGPMFALVVLLAALYVLSPKYLMVKVLLPFHAWVAFTFTEIVPLSTFTLTGVPFSSLSV